MANHKVDNYYERRRIERARRRRKKKMIRRRRTILAYIFTAVLVLLLGRFAISKLSDRSSAESDRPEKELALQSQNLEESKEEEKEDSFAKNVDIEYLTEEELRARKPVPRTEKVQVNHYQDKIDTFLVTARDARLYNRDSAKSTIEAMLPAGTYVETYGHENGWTKVTSEGKEGFIRDADLEVIPDASKFHVINGHVIVNARYGLDENYVTVFNKDAAAALRVMLEAMDRDNCKVEVGATYRTAAEEAEELVYRGNPAGAPEPGHAEFQTGFGVQFFEPGTDPRMDNDFEKSEAFDWLMKNAHNYGFVLRYPKGSESITGYRADPTIFTYVGVEDASIMSNEGLTLEVYYGVE